MSAASKTYGPVPFARLAAGVLGPVAAKRGFAKADLVAAWDEVAGPRYAAVTRPEKLQWPRDGAGGAVLTVRVAGPSAVLLQHETEQFIARVNAFLGYNAVTQLRIMQRPIEAPPRAKKEPPPLSDAEKQAVAEAVADVESDGLRAALMRLGTAIAADGLARE